MGSAIPLQEVRVIGVCSEKSKGKWEKIQKNQSMTRQSHGGAFLRIATIDIGYGHSGIAKMNSSRLEQYDSEVITNNSGIACAFVKYWNADGYNGGNFTYENGTINGVYATKSTRLLIQS